MDHLIVIVRYAHKDAHVGAVFEVKNLPRIFKRLPCGRQKEPMLRVDIGCFTRRNAEELRIELIECFYETAMPRECLAGDTRFGIVKTAHIPAIRGYFAYYIAALDEQPPERIWIVRTTRKPETHSSDCDAVFAH